ncbi:MAG: GNAT family N-acetyltransferase [archaeon]|nr:GNAT family N-acetyltransferase [archaeon]MCP8306747.1 GNAT family N-acetyltransferase [archaeon]
MIVVKKLTIPNLQSLDVTDGFTWSIKSSSEEGKVKFKELLRQKLSDGAEILLAVEGDEIVGFAVIVDWQALPNTKFLDAMEVAKPYRSKGIGSMIMQRMVEEWDTLIALTPSSEPGFEEKLRNFYRRFGFKAITSDIVEPVIMVRIPSDSDRLKEWVEYIEKALKEYSYQTYKIQPILHIWGRRYAPWLKYTGDVYPPLLKEVKACIEEQGKP